MLTTLALGAAALVQTPAEPEETLTLLVNYAARPSDDEVAWYRDTLGATVKYRYDIIPTLAVVVDADEVARIAERPGVDFVEADSTWQTMDLGNVWGVNFIGGGYTLGDSLFGAGVKVAVIDTGIDYNHPELAPVYQGGYDYVNNDADPRDDHYHGTHVSGTIAAALDGSGVVGMAPGVELYGVKGLDSSGSGQTSDLIACVDWTTTNGMDVVNNSWGGGGSATLEAAFDASRAAGVIHVCAAGNWYGIFGVLPPARYASTYAISAIDSTGALAAFSDRGPEVDFAAPGVDVYSTDLGGGFRTASGTSMASPHAAGAVALVLAHGGLVDGDGDGHLWNEVRQRMAQTSMDFGAPGKDNLYGFGIVNAQAAVEQPLVLSASNLVAGQPGGLQATGCAPGEAVGFLYSTTGGGRYDVPQAGALLNLANPDLLGIVNANGAGVATIQFNVPPSAAGLTVLAQAVSAGSNSSRATVLTVN